MIRILLTPRARLPTTRAHTQHEKAFFLEGVLFARTAQFTVMAQARVLRNSKNSGRNSGAHGDASPSRARRSATSPAPISM